MLRVGLTGGIGSGKSTVARRLVSHGAVLVDSDVLAREVVAPGTDGLAEIVGTFGRGVLDADGALDRPTLASIVFGDRAARERLNAIVHPRVRRRSDELVGAAPADAVVVLDVPLLVEGGMAPSFPLVVVVHAPTEERVGRLVTQRGMSEDDARARVTAQAGDEDRRAAADVWIDNGGAPTDLDTSVDALWRERLVPFEENLRLRRPVPTDGSPPVEPTPDRVAGWAADAARIRARVVAAAGEWNRGVAHVGPTAVPGTWAPDVIDLQLGVPDAAGVAAAGAALELIGFPRCAVVEDGGRRHGTADPGRPVRVHVREVDSPGWRDALLMRDWRRAVPGPESGRERAEAWAASSGWVPSLG